MRDLKIVGNKRNNITKFFLLSMVVLLMIFFSSKFFLPDASPIKQTLIGSKVPSLTAIDLTLAKWEYSEKKELMEVTLQYTDKSSDTMNQNTRITFNATNEDYTVTYPTDIVYHDENTYVVQLKNVPKNYKTVDLKVTEHIRDNSFDIKNGTVQFDPTGKVIEDSSYNQTSEDTGNHERVNSAYIYADYRKTKINNKLVTKSNKQYKQELLVLEISNNEKKIQYVENANKKVSRNIEKVQEKIARLNDSKKYKTDVEKESVDSEIQSLSNDIQDFKNAISTNKQYIGQLKEKNQLLKMKQKDNKMEGLK